MTSVPDEYDLYPKVTDRGELPPLVLERLDERYWNHDEKLPVGGSTATVVNALDHGAKGDGSVNDAPAIQAAANAAAGGTLFIPKGRYWIDDDYGVRVPAHTTVRGERGTVLFSTRRIDAFLRAYGYISSSDKVELAAGVGIGDRTITTKTDHPYQPGDVIRLVSQRVATSSDAGEWRMGWSTGDNPGPRFTEYSRVLSVQNPRTVLLDRGLIYPNYLPDGSQETDQYAGTSTVLMRTDGAGDNVIIEDLSFEGEAYRAVHIIEATGCRVRRVNAWFPAVRSAMHAVRFSQTYACRAEDCHTEYEETLEDESVHYYYNAYLAGASQSSGFVGCSAVRSTQSFDITYEGSPDQTSQFCYIKDCFTSAATSNPLTLHPGVYACVIMNNNLTECLRSGISIRGNSSLVAGNQVSGAMLGTGQTSNPGIYLLEGGGKNTLITGNTVRNFRVGFRINDGGNKPFESWAGPTVVGNVFEGFVVGAARTRMYGQPDVTASQGIIFKGNTLVTDKLESIGVLTCENGRGVAGWSISGNDFRLPRGGSVGVQVTGPSGEMSVTGNTFHEVGQMLAWDPTGVTSGSPQTVVHWAANTALSLGIDRFPPPVEKFQVDCTDGTMQILPGIDYTLNWTRWSGRWRSASTANTTMDRGWPVEGFSGYVDAVRMASTWLMQTGYGSDGRRHIREWSSTGGWTNWKVV